MRPAAVSVSAAGGFDHIPAAAERIAEQFGVITSTFRTVAHNRAVGGVPDSFHLLGRAMDVVRRPGISHAQIAAALRKAGYVLAESLDEGTHSHFAFGSAATPAKSAVVVPEAAPPGPRLAADDHGSLLSDLTAKQPRKGHRGSSLRASPR